MIKIPYEQLIVKIKEQASLSDEEISSKIKAKMDQLSGLISKEGAAHIIANELKVKLFEEGKLKIDKIFSGMRSVETVGKITNLFDIREFARKDGSQGKVASIVIADDTASIRLVLWNDQTDKAKGLKVGDILKVGNAFSKENQGKPELHINSNSELEINPPGETIGEVSTKRPEAKRKKIEELQATDSNIELLGTIVQIFDPRFYEICPECGKRAKQKESAFACDTHGIVTPNFAYVLNLILDDGSSTIRAIFFRNQLANLLQKSDEEILKFKGSPESFGTIKEDLLGKIVKIVGRVSKNEMFDRLEFISQLVFPDPNPDDELKKLQKEAEVIE
jgi:replication factor A1